MKKALVIAMALVLAFSMTVIGFADAKEDFQSIISELAQVSSPEEIQAAVTTALKDAGITDAEVDAGSLTDGTANDVAATIVSSLNLTGTDLEKKIQDAMSNDFVSFLAGLYIPVDVPTQVATTVPATEAPLPPTGSSSTIAIATFATLSVVAAAAFVCLKKKEA
ncbi:MAG: hypothetical protein LBJ11_10500 [Oscillospiraceae bacterium]|jgi:hypothetical protein|nr:hypothetical protein [Oscillospiraceae bacterium]